jgi:hypothetical protein
MISSWKKKRAARCTAAKVAAEHPDESGGDLELTIPNHFQCPISLDLMKDPVTLVTGLTYDRENIEKWLEAGNVTCPITSQVMENHEAIPNHTIRKLIQNWCVDNKSNGVKRIPTPRIPMSSSELAEILAKIERSCIRDDQIGCQNLVAKIKRLIKESERNKRCIVRNGTSRVLAAAFDEFSKRSDKNGVVLEEILSALGLLFPLDGEAKRKLASPSSLDSIIWLLNSRDLSRRRIAILSLRQIVSNPDHEITPLEINEEAIESIFRVLKDAICPTTTKASLTVIHNLMTSPSSPSSPNRNGIVSKFVDLGLVPILLELLVETDKSTSEKSLLVLDAIIRCSEEGRHVAYDHSLTIPVLVKKLLRVSGLGNETVVSILWNLYNGEYQSDFVEVLLVEALQLGAFQKLLLLLQVGCGESTKQKATELLKLLNLRRDRYVECIDSKDYKSLKRPF